MPREKVQEIARRGAAQAEASGTRHVFTAEERKLGGKRGHQARIDKLSSAPAETESIDDKPAVE